MNGLGVDHALREALAIDRWRPTTWNGRADKQIAPVVGVVLNVSAAVLIRRAVASAADGGRGPSEDPSGTTTEA